MNFSNLIELNNIRVLSTTFEKLLITITEEQADIIKVSATDIHIKTLESEEWGTSYTVVIKCCNDKMADLYKTIKRRDIVKGLYDIVVSPTVWNWLDKTGTRLDAFFIRKNIQPPVINLALMTLTNPIIEEEPAELVVAPKRNSRTTKK